MWELLKLSKTLSKYVTPMILSEIHIHIAGVEQFHCRWDTFCIKDLCKWPYRPRCSVSIPITKDSCCLLMLSHTERIICICILHVWVLVLTLLSLLEFGPWFTVIRDKIVTPFLFLHHFVRPPYRVMCMCKRICQEWIYVCQCCSVVNIKAATSGHMLNIIQNNNLLYKILQPLQDQMVVNMDSCSGCT